MGRMISINFKSTFIFLKIDTLRKIMELVIYIHQFLISVKERYLPIFVRNISLSEIVSEIKKVTIPSGIKHIQKALKE